MQQIEYNPTQQHIRNMSIFLLRSLDSTFGIPIMTKGSVQLQISKLFKGYEYDNLIRRDFVRKLNGIVK